MTRKTPIHIISIYKRIRNGKVETILKVRQKFKNQHKFENYTFPITRLIDNHVLFW